MVTGLEGFQKSLRPFSLDESRLSIGRVKRRNSDIISQIKKKSISIKGIMLNLLKICLSHTGSVLILTISEELW